MNIVVTNDDGVDTAGIQILAEASVSLGNTTIVAPSKNYSGSSSAITLSRDIEIYKRDNDTFVVDGTPTDCARFAYSGALGFTPDVVLSGINHGANLSDDIIYSGTFGAAREGRFLKKTPVAFSVCGVPVDNWVLAKSVAIIFIKFIKSYKMPHGVVLNVNIPPITTDDCKGLAVTKLGYSSGVERKKNRHLWNINERNYLPIPVPAKDRISCINSDLNAVLEGYVSVTAVNLEYEMKAKFKKEISNFWHQNF